MTTIFVYLLQFYKKWFSPLLGNNCRFHPSCSEYMIDAIKAHGICFGILLGIYRLIRCNPWNVGGFDPVPKEIFNCKNSKNE